MAGRLQNKVVLVTGAGSVGPGWGNGRAIAVRMVQEGAKVMALDRDQDRLEETLARAHEVSHVNGGEIDSMTCDVTDTAAIEATVQATLKRFGRIDVLINNVGGSAAGGPVEMSEDVWDAQIDHNLKSVFMMCKHVLPVMAQQGAGAVVNISSTSGIRWTGSAQVAYAATKAAVIQLGRVVAVQYAKQGIRVNTVVPGQLHTPMVDVRLAKQRTGGDVHTLLTQRQARIPLPFMGDGQDTANAVLFLASDEARFITGTEIIVDGGMSARCD
jgi:NAD(P)-dependent dehydrogenase (short-subunit alcohol dehydrogenase family)